MNFYIQFNLKFGEYNKYNLSYRNFLINYE